MLKRSAWFVPVIAAGFLTTLAPRAAADDTLDVPFDGVVFERCQLTLNSSGQLESIGGGSSTYELKANDAHGLPAEVVADCNGSATLSASSPVQTGGPTLSSFGLWDGYVRDGYGGVFNSSVGLSPGAMPIQVGMEVDNNGLPIPGGNYSFIVTITAVPN